MVSATGGGAAAEDFVPDFFGAAFEVEAEAGLAVGGVGAMAGEAMIGENRPDVTIEFDGLGRERGHEQQRGQTESPHVHYGHVSISSMVAPGC